ncbi:C-type lectin mannose-binding isoform-like [Branchiostoma floridae x Branchiostoma japonicum]
MEACKKEGATLAMPKTEELDVALRNLVKTEGGNAYHWIGMVEKKGTWYWADGSKVDNNQYKGWYPGKPDNFRWIPLCGQYWPDGTPGYPTWDDSPCFNLKSFICQCPTA